MQRNAIPSPTVKYFSTGFLQTSKGHPCDWEICKELKKES